MRCREVSLEWQLTNSPNHQLTDFSRWRIGVHFFTFLPPMRLPLLSVVVASSLASTSSAAQSPIAASLDSIVKARLANVTTASVSVAVVRGRDTLLSKAYGLASIELSAPATPLTTYRVPALALATATMQQVERGRLRLADDASLLMPEFPWQGRHVTVRQLLDATSGLTDYHYLGDARTATRGTPKEPDELLAAFAGRPFMHEPGAKYQWTVSGFHIAGMLIERLSGMPFGDYTRKEIIERAGLRHSFYCDDKSVVPGLPPTYSPSFGTMYRSDYENWTLFRYSWTLCTTALDAASLLRGLRDGRLMSAKSYEELRTPVGAAAGGPGQPSRGAGLAVGSEDGHRWLGENGNALGFSASMRDYPDDSLTIAVLSNSGGTFTLDVNRSLARALFGLSPLPLIPLRRPPADTRPVVTIAPAELERYAGWYRTHRETGSTPLTQWERTYRVYLWNGKLMLQATGEEAEVMTYRGDDTFTVPSNPTPFSFAMKDGRAISMTRSGATVETGPRIAKPD